MLIVEDEALIVMMVSKALEDAGFEVVGHTRSVDQALELLDETSPAAVILDINLGGETSMAIADALVEKNIPFVIVTGYGPNGVPERHRRAPLLSKPFDLSDLREIVSDLCRSPAQVK